MAVYTAPNFNLLANVWSSELNSLTGRWTYLPPTRAADFQVQAQLYIQQRVALSSYAIPFASGVNVASSIGARIDLRVPAGTFIRYPVPNQLDGSSNFDLVEIPAGSGLFYFIVFVIDVHTGFPNQYRMAELIPYTRYGQPEDATLELHDSFVIAIGTFP